MDRVTHRFVYGQHEVVLETGVIAKQATSAVMVQMGNTVLLATTVVHPTKHRDGHFFPLSIQYQERCYAAGKVPGSFFRREGRPGDSEILTARLIDRSVRPLFPKTLRDEVQVVVTLLSLDPQVPPDIPAVLGACAALSLSGLPFQGPVVAARIGLLDGEFLLNPSTPERSNSALDLFVVMGRNGLVNAEATAKEIAEEDLLRAVKFAEMLQTDVLEQLKRFIREAKKISKASMHSLPAGQKQADDQHDLEIKTLTEWVKSNYNRQIRALFMHISDSEKDGLEREGQNEQRSLQAAPRYATYQAYQEAWKTLKEQILAAAQQQPELMPYFSGNHLYGLSSILEEIYREEARSVLLHTGIRRDGRQPETIREIEMLSGFLPAVHGSALFTRGETQALATVTLGSDREAKSSEDLSSDKPERFMLHYNFLPFSVGEIGLLGSPKRREIGHGHLARKAFLSVMPPYDNFPYVVRVVSEITESNGSSSMATVCASSLALMDAGVPIQKAVAGIAMGLIKGEGEEYIVLSDITALEDHIGDMDLKIAGTDSGVNAIQLDIKTNGITEKILVHAMLQARQARLHILQAMQKVCSAPALALPETVPKVYHTQIPPEKIKELIGRGGNVIKRLSDEFNAKIEVSEKGEIKLMMSDAAAAKRLIAAIHALTLTLEVGKSYEGVIARIEEYGIFVDFAFPSSKIGLIHSSELSKNKGTSSIQNFKIGEKVQVKILFIDLKNGRMKLTLLPENKPAPSINVSSKKLLPESETECSTDVESETESML